jgi:transcriptional regulator with XRE-family HTH domain
MVTKMTGQPKFRVTGDQIAAGRRLIRMTQEELAQLSGITDRTIAAFETDKTIPHDSTIEALQTALEDQGLVFTTGENPGVIFVRRAAVDRTKQK